MLAGFLAYLLFSNAARRSIDSSDHDRSLWLSALIAGITAHFVETQFGISVVTTELHFWFYAALLVVLGTNQLSKTSNTRPNQMHQEVHARGKRRNSKAQAIGRQRTPEQSIFVWAAIVTLVLLTLSFGFVGNRVGSTNAFQVLLQSLFSVRDQMSASILSLFTISWIVAAVIGVLETDGLRASEIKNRFRQFIAISLIAALGLIGLQTIILTQRDDPQNIILDLLAFYLISLFLIIFAIAAGLFAEERREAKPLWLRSPVIAVAIPLLLTFTKVD